MKYVYFFGGLYIIFFNTEKAEELSMGREGKATSPGGKAVTGHRIQVQASCVPTKGKLGGSDSLCVSVRGLTDQMVWLMFLHTCCPGTHVLCCTWDCFVLPGAARGPRGAALCLPHKPVPDAGIHWDPLGSTGLEPPGPQGLVQSTLVVSVPQAIRESAL